MELVAIVTLCMGCALGLRFKVFILLPAILISIALITTVALSRGAGIGTVSVLNIIAAVGLQFGYLGGIWLWSMTSAGRLAERKNTHPARPFAP
jgi:hypothetical protein